MLFCSDHFDFAQPCYNETLAVWICSLHVSECEVHAHGDVDLDSGDCLVSNKNSFY